MDDRFNGGGWVQTFVNNILGAKISGYFNMRNSREPWSRQSDAFLGPMCCLINEFAISCGEEFPHRFKDLELGPLIGRRTMGGEIGSSPGWPLVDGGVISVPNYGMYTMKDGWVIEGAGVSPDLDVPSDPNAWTAGKDPQLDAAVKSMLDALKKKPVVWPKDPAPRIRVKKS
jgi:tricorn protease